MKWTYKELQTEIEQLRHENSAYQLQYNRMRSDLDQAQKLLNHSEELHELVGQLAAVPEANIQALIAAFTAGRPRNQLPISRNQGANVQHGICLHVQHGKFSVKFCSECDSPSNDNW